MKKLLAQKNFKRFLGAFIVLIIIVASVFGGAISDRLYGLKFLDKFLPKNLLPSITNQRILTEESVVIDVVDKVGPSVVTVGMTQTQSVNPFEGNPFFDPFGFFSAPQGQSQKVEQDIGSGFIIDKSGLIVTNKHVVADTQATYKVFTSDDKEYEVQKIYRDPVNDMAILKINPPASPAGGSAGPGFKPVELGDSDKLKVGQFVIAIGTALGEFRQTVTTGVVSGLGRGITAGSAYEGYVEKLDNVIQTDAAINPGNSGGPLLNSGGQVIGVNAAIASQGQNIGFAIPINVVKEAINNFNKTGKFERPYLGVRYRMISQKLALLNDVPQGAYVVEVVSGSPAEKAEVKVEDIITKFDDQTVNENSDLAKMINQKKVGDSVKLKIWRNGQELELSITLQETSQ
jgi:serine protease Do